MKNRKKVRLAVGELYKTKREIYLYQTDFNGNALRDEFNFFTTLKVPKNDIFVVANFVIDHRINDNNETIYKERFVCYSTELKSYFRVYMYDICHIQFDEFLEQI